RGVPAGGGRLPALHDGSALAPVRLTLDESRDEATIHPTASLRRAPPTVRRNVGADVASSTVSGGLRAPVDIFRPPAGKWAIVDSNHGPPPYQSGALTN